MLRPLGVVAALALALGLVGPAVADELPDPQDPTAQLSIDKTSSSAEVGPGDTLVYTIQVGCSAISDVGCRDAITTDVIPAPLEIVNVVPSGPNDAANPTINGQNVRVDWTEDLSAGAIGMLDNTTSQVAITVHVPEDVSFDLDGTTLTNQAVAEATNALDVTDSVDVTMNVPLELATSPTKEFDPTNALAAAGTPVTASLTGTNDSNATVDTLVIQDPVDPTATPNPFTFLGFTGFGAVTPPEGSTSTTYEVFVDGAWVPVPGGELPPPDPADVRGTRVTFSGAIPPDATAAVDLELATTDEAAAVAGDTTVTNTVQSQVTLDGESATDTASDDFLIRANAVTVAASKAFDPDLVIAGESSTVTLGARNDSPIPIDSLTITEPSDGDFPPEYTFGGFTGPIAYPANATSGVVIYQPSGESVAFPNNGTPAPPAGGPASVTSFQVVFTGNDEDSNAILPGAETSIPFQVDTDPDLDPADLPSMVTNQVDVEGQNNGVTGDDTAEDDLFIYDEVIEPYIDKQVRPSQILAAAGQVVTVTLQGGTTERPNPPDDETGTTGNADQIVIQDPQDPVEPNAWWNIFDLSSIAQTPVPADSTLTIEYYDPASNTWVPFAGPIAGPTIYSQDVPDDIAEVAGGVRFVYDYTGTAGGFAPGTDLSPNFTASLRETGRYDGVTPPYNTDPDQPPTVVPECAQTTASSPTEGVPDGTAAMDPPDCPEIDILPVDGGGGGGGAGDLIDKEFVPATQAAFPTVIARSGDAIPSILSWSTGGYSGFESVEITDVPDPPVPVEDTVYEAFNLTRVEPITAATDPFLTYDQVTNVQLWNGTAFVDATNDPCPALCDGTFPGMDLTATEQESTTSVRLTFAESPTRADRIVGNPDAPPVGSGVARSIGNNRHITLVWQVRDTHRSTGEPALGEDIYNEGAANPGLVRNDVNATGFPFDDGDPVSDDASDTVLILDVPITTTTDKIWRGGPLAVPTPGTPADQYPLSEMTVTTTNTTPAKVDQLQITDPAPTSVPQTDPFNWFTLDNIDTITVPPGALTTEVFVSCSDGSVPPDQPYTREEALAFTAATLPCDVSGVQVLFDGRIDAGGQGVLSLDLRLRANQRDGGAPISDADSPIANTAEGIAADVAPIADCPPPDDARYACDQGSATIALAAPTFGIEAGKSISPASQTEGDFAPVTVTASAQNNGSAHPFIDQITDDDPTFWNAVDFIQMDPSWTLPVPVEHVQACYLSGGNFTPANVEADTVGGDFTCQEVPGGGLPDPGELTLEDARQFINDAAQTVDIHGLRFRFLAGDQGGWQSPANPLIQVPFQVERRIDLRTGGPVPTTRSDQTPAPGEADAGIFVDTVEVEGVSVLVGPTQRLRASDTADAPYTHEHLTVGVEVGKSPSGELPPGQVIPFTLTYENTGDRALTNPVFTDVLPSDAEGNQLIFDPDSDPTINSPYGFELAGAAPTPPSGDPLPTDQDLITITESGDTITFDMPEGSVLEVGQTYTITIELMLRPGLTPDDLVTNEARIIADEPFDPGSCSPNLDTGTGECWADATVSPIEVAALSTVKKVKGDTPVDEPGVPEVFLDRSVIPAGTDIPDDFCDTAADDDGFYRAPCVPVTRPGDTETWEFTITNAGTLPIDRLVSMDRLPVPGDEGLIVTLPRGTEWKPTWVGNIQLTTGDGAESAELQAFYSTPPTPCIDDLDPLGPPCPPGAWLPFDAANPPPLGDVANLKLQIDFADDLFDPGEQITLRFQTRTTPETIGTDFPVAWNTVATGGRAFDGSVASRVTATEGRKVGVTYPTGPIQLEKVVSGEGEEFAPDSFTVQLECTSADTDMEDLPEVTLVPGADPTQVDGLPLDAECTATETDQGQAEAVIGTGTVGGPTDTIGLVSIENVFLLGDMSVTKTVTSDAVDQGGNAIEYGPFQVSVTCVYLGEEVVADGFDSSPMEFTVADAETVDLTGLPVGAECTTTEPGSADAAQVNISPAQPIVITDTTATNPPVEVGIENVYTDGSLHLVKLVDGAALENNPVLGTGPFTLHVACTLTDASHPAGEVVYDADVVLEGEQPLEQTIDSLPTGAVCDVTETDSGGATSFTIDPSQVTIGDGTTVDVTATNTFEAGSMTVTKAVETDAVDQDGNPISYGPFEISVECTDEGQVVLADGYDSSPMVTEIADGQTVAFSGLPVGATCTTTETDTADAENTTIAPEDPVTIGQAPAAVAVTVTNEFTVGSLDLIKLVEGAALDNNPVLGTGPFTLHVTCTLTDASHAGTTVYDDDVVLEGEQPLEQTIDNLPTGAVCDVTEPDQGGATSFTIDPSQVTIGDGSTVDVTAANTFAVGDLSVTKAVDSAAVDQDGNPIAYGPFEIAVMCTLDGNAVFASGYDAGNPMEETIEDGETVEFTSLPTGSECTVTEPDSADAATTAITPEQPVTIGNTDDPGGDPGSPVEVEVENHYDVGSLRLVKFVPQAARPFPISQGPFTLHVTCTLTDASHPGGEVVYVDDFVLQGEQPLVVQVDDIAAGAVCTVTEPDDGAANAHLIVPDMVTIEANRTVRVVTTNLFGAGSLKVTKTVQGPGAELYGAGPFEVSVTCTFTNVDGDQQPINTPGGPTRELNAANNYTATYDPLLLGSTCQIKETRTGGATSTVITNAAGQEVNQFTVNSLTEPLQINVTNTFEVGSIKVTKKVVGVGPSRFEVKLACTHDVDGTETSVEIPSGPERTLTKASGFTATYADLPVGAECTLRETEDGGADRTAIRPNAGDPEVGVVTVATGATVHIVVKNTFEPNIGPGDDDNGPDDNSGPGDNDNGPSGILPDTGTARGLLALLIAGLALLGVGVMLVGRGRRRHP